MSALQIFYDAEVKVEKPNNFTACITLCAESYFISNLYFYIIGKSENFISCIGF